MHEGLSATPTLQATPLTPSAFAPFGAVLANPAPDTRPPSCQNSNSAGNGTADLLPPGAGAVVANQGTAIQYRALAPPLQDLYADAPSGQPSTPRTTMFVCAARQLLVSPPESSSSSAASNRSSASKSGGGLFFPVAVLERHPFTTQTFVPLGSSASARYLVIVAPTLPSPPNPPVPVPVPATGKGAGPGLPDLQNLRAFVATGAQAVTYGAGTWHAPMAALGEHGSAIEFVVVQFANDVPLEDCQEVALDVGGGGKGAGVLVEVPRRVGESKL